MIRDPANGLINAVDAPPLHHEILSRLGWRVTDAAEPAEVVVSATDAELVTVRSGAGAASTGPAELPALLQSWPSSGLRCAAEHVTAAALAGLSSISPYFAATTGPLTTGDWYPVATLDTDEIRLADAVDRIAGRMGVTELRVAAVDVLSGVRGAAVVARAGGARGPQVALRLDPRPPAVPPVGWDSTAAPAGPGRVARRTAGVAARRPDSGCALAPTQRRHAAALPDLGETAVGQRRLYGSRCRPRAESAPRCCAGRRAELMARAHRPRRRTPHRPRTIHRHRYELPTHHVLSVLAQPRRPVVR